MNNVKNAQHLKIIIFSFNRALQLEALLASLRKFWKRPEVSVTVIYNASDETFQKGYNILQDDYKEYRFIKETRNSSCWHFCDYFSLYNLKKMLKYPNQRKQKTNFRDLINAELADDKAEYVMFLTDDSAFFQEVNISDDDFAFIDKNPRQNQVSLRLGKNITSQPQDICMVDGRMKWQFHEHRDARSWGYEFSVDAHIYAKSLMREVLKKVIYNNPTSLEGNVVYYARENGLMDSGMTYESPFILSYPLNMVQNIANNESLDVSVELLNKLFLEGKRLLYIIPEDISEFQQYPSEVLLIKGEETEVLKLK